MNDILDFVVISLLVVAIVYGTILNRKISLLQQSKQELANLFKSFDDTILKAQIGIDELKNVSNEASELLNKKMDKAYILIDDLSFLSEKAAKVTNIMDEKVKSNQKKISQLEAEKPSISNNKNDVFSSPRPEEIVALRKQRASIDTPPVQNVENDNIKPFVNNKKAKALEALLEQINESKSSNKAPNKKNNKNESFSSEQEQDEEKIVANMLKAIGYGDS